MRKIYSLALLAAALLISANGWAQETSSYPKNGHDVLQEGDEAMVTYAPKGGTATTKYYASLEEAFTSVDGELKIQSDALKLSTANVESSFGAENPITIQVLKNVEWIDDLNQGTQLFLHSGQHITLDLNGNTIEGKQNILRVFMCCANLTITNTASTWATWNIKEIEGVSAAVSVFSLYGSAEESATDYTVLTFTGKVKINAPCYGAVILSRQQTGSSTKCAYGVEMNILNGAHLYSLAASVCPNGEIQTTKNNPVFNIKNATVETYGEFDPDEQYSKPVRQPDGSWKGIPTDNPHYFANPQQKEGQPAIYASGNCIWNIENSTIKGPIGIYVKAGQLNIKDSEVYSNGSCYAVPLFYGNGVLANGVGIVFDSNANYGEMGGLSITGTTKVTAEKGYAIEEVITKGDLKLTGDNFVIEGGEFKGGEDVNGKALTTTIEMVKELQDTEDGGIKGGIFSNQEDAKDYINKNVGTVTPVEREDGSIVYVVNQDANATYKTFDEAGKDDYVEIKGTESKEVNATTGNKDFKYLKIMETATLTVKAGSTLTVGGILIDKDAKIIVEAGAKLIVNGNGIVADNVANIVLQMNNEKQAVMLLDPTVAMNYTTPSATVQLYAEVGKDAYGDYAWRRMGSPVLNVEGFEKSVNYATAIYKWDYNADAWAQINAISELQPFAGYTLTQTDASGKNPITYTFKGKTVGNKNVSLEFSALGYNYFANSYTGYAAAKEMLATIMNNKDVEATVWRFDDVNQVWLTASMAELEASRGDFLEIAPMQTFILRLMNGATSTVSVDYKNAIWENRANDVHKAPAKQVKSDDTYVKIIVTAANGQTDRVSLMEDTKYSDEFDNGADATKYMNTKHINFYAETDYAEQTVVASDNVEGTMLSLQTLDEVSYTLTFSNVSGKEYAIKDMQTGIVTAMEEGNSYEFVASANSTINNRFQIVGRQNVTTSIDETTIQTKAQGVYTILGQYVGDITMWNTLPAGVYVVDGVKVVK